MSATARRAARGRRRFVEVSVLPVPRPSAEDADEPRVLVLRGVSTLLPREQLVDLEADLLRRRREHHDVVCAGLERAPEEAVGDPCPSTMTLSRGSGGPRRPGAARRGPSSRRRRRGADRRRRRAATQGLLGPTTPTTLKSASRAASPARPRGRPGLDGEESCTGRLGIRLVPLPQHRSGVRRRRLRRLRADDRPEDEVELRVVGCVGEVRASSSRSAGTRPPPLGPGTPIREHLDVRLEELHDAGDGPCRCRRSRRPAPARAPVDVVDRDRDAALAPVICESTTPCRSRRSRLP